MKKALIYITILLSVSDAYGQYTFKDLSAGFRFHSGLNLPVYNAVDYIVEDGIYSLDAYVQKQSDGNHLQDELWNFPAYGAGYSRWSLGNNEIFGRAHVIYAHMQVPFNRSYGKIRFGMRASAGAAYLTKCFDVENNNINRAIGSHMNIYMNLAAWCDIDLVNKLDLVLDAGLVHFSNGKTRSPNYGINAATVSAGLRYDFFPEVTVTASMERPSVPRKYFHTVSFSGGRKVYDDLTGMKFLSTTISYGIERYLTHSGKVGFGTNIFYDGSIRMGLKEKGEHDPEFNELMRIGLHASYSLCYKRTIAGLQAGYYVHSRFTVLTRMYTRISLGYLVTKNINIGFSIRSHFGKADALEYGISYTW